MPKRAVIAIGMAGGVIWALALIWLGREYHATMRLDFEFALVLSFVLPGLVMMAMIGRGASLMTR